MFGIGLVFVCLRVCVCLFCVVVCVDFELLCDNVWLCCFSLCVGVCACVSCFLFRCVCVSFVIYCAMLYGVFFV